MLTLVYSYLVSRNMCQLYHGGSVEHRVSWSATELSGVLEHGPEKVA